MTSRNECSCEYCAAERKRAGRWAAFEVAVMGTMFFAACGYLWSL